MPCALTATAGRSVLKSTLPQQRRFLPHSTPWAATEPRDSPLRQSEQLWQRGGVHLGGDIVHPHQHGLHRLCADAVDGHCPRGALSHGMGEHLAEHRGVQRQNGTVDLKGRVFRICWWSSTAAGGRSGAAGMQGDAWCSWCPGRGLLQCCPQASTWCKTQSADGLACCMHSKNACHCSSLQSVEVS